MARWRKAAGRCLVAVAAAVSFPSPVSRAIAQPSTASATPVLGDLGRIGEFRSLFDRDSDKVRIVLLLSPT